MNAKRVPVRRSKWTFPSTLAVKYGFANEMHSIIAVSGLSGHAFGSFKQRGGSFMWLRDGLPKDLLDTRVFIYGYDTQLQGSSSAQNLTDLGMSLQTALIDLLSKDVCFYGHLDKGYANAYTI